jgi:hypothetical protein
MYASLAAKAAAGQKEIPNQGTATDINIVSTLLPYCDAMFVDNKCRALLQDIPRDYALPHACKVFSPNTGADFIQYLTEIRDSVTPDHSCYQIFGCLMVRLLSQGQMYMHLYGHKKSIWDAHLVAAICGVCSAILPE